MSVQKINVLVSPQHRLSPGGAWLADAVAGLIVAAASSFAAWRSRAMQEAAARRIARDRSDLRALAALYMKTQPSLAKDLMSAAMTEREV